MPFDGTPVANAPKRLYAVGSDLLHFGTTPTPPAYTATSRPIPAWHSSRRPEYVGDTLAVLARAQELIADERRWCRRSFALSWFNVPVSPHSAAARRYCALGAVMHASRKLGSPVEQARNALEWQTARPVQDWNDDPLRTHAEVVAAFDAAIAALHCTTV
jgi:hypothetical protein